MNNKNYRCQQCTDHCVGMCAKDWHPESDDDYNPEAAIQWLGVAVIIVLCLFLYGVFA